MGATCCRLSYQPGDVIKCRNCIKAEELGSKLKERYPLYVIYVDLNVIKIYSGQILLSGNGQLETWDLNVAERAVDMYKKVYPQLSTNISHMGGSLYFVNFGSG